MLGACLSKLSGRHDEIRGAEDRVQVYLMLDWVTSCQVPAIEREERTV